MTKYPTELIDIDTGESGDLSTIQDGTTEILAIHHNIKYEEIIAIETELGTNPSGSVVSLKERLSKSLADDGAISTQESSIFRDKIFIKDARICIAATNNSGGTLEIGDVVSIESSPKKVDKAGVLNDNIIYGVVYQDAENGQNVVICTSGYALCKYIGSVSRGDTLVASATAGFAQKSVSDSHRNVIGMVIETNIIGSIAGIIVNPTRVANAISGYSGVSFSGTSGYSGSQGLSGTSPAFSGTSGVRGYSGYSGERAAGTSGTSGISGYSGSSGYEGETALGGLIGLGDIGELGFSGTSGYSGEHSSFGVSGYSGQSGYSGESGYSGQSGYSGAVSRTASRNISDSPSPENIGGFSIFGDGKFSLEAAEVKILDNQIDWRDRFIQIDILILNDLNNKKVPGGSLENLINGYYRPDPIPSDIYENMIGGILWSYKGSEGKIGDNYRLVLKKAGFFNGAIYATDAGNLIFRNYNTEDLGGAKYSFVFYAQASPKQNHIS